MGGERRHLRKDIEKICENFLKVATASNTEINELWATICPKEIVRYKNSLKADPYSQLLIKEKCMLSLNEHKRKCQLANIFTMRGMTTTKYSQLMHLEHPIQGRLTLCQILGEFKLRQSTVSLSNTFETLVLRYHLSNEDASSLPKACQPGPLAGQLSSQVKNDEEEQMREL